MQRAVGKAGDCNESVRELPIALLVPQALLVVGILVLSLYPKLLMDPVSAAIDPPVEWPAM